MPNMPSNGTTNMMMNMQMSFYWGRKATVLFSGWPNNNLGMYILAILFVFFLAMAAEVLSNQPPIKRGTNPLVGFFVTRSRAIAVANGEDQQSLSDTIKI
ncbi:hypothetical protein P8452_59943 [Trifolium repens]|nr:hypothetical protein P8452_59943 [Trifolium repens]